MGQVIIKDLSREEWLKERQNGVGSSEIAAVLGLNPYQSALDVYNSKIKDPDREREETQKTKVGNIIEPVVAQIFQEETGLRVQNDNKIRFQDNHPFVRVNIDRMILTPPDKDGPGVLEMKNTEHRTIAKWEEDEDGVKLLPMYYWCQIQSQLFASGWDWGHVYFFVSGYDTRDFYVEPNKQFLDDMLNEVGIFWHNHVLKQIPPAPRTAEEVQKLFPKSTMDKTVEAGDTLYNFCVQASALDQEIKSKEKQYAELKDKITVALGDAEILTHKGQILATYKSSKKFDAEKFRKEQPGYAAQCLKKVVDAKIVKAKYPEMHEKFSDRTGSRRFLLK